MGYYTDAKGCFRIIPTPDRRQIRVLAGRSEGYWSVSRDGLRVSGCCSMRGHRLNWEPELHVLVAYLKEEGFHLEGTVSWLGEDGPEDSGTIFAGCEGVWFA